MMVASACRAHSKALIDFIDRREVDAATAGALRHLERCPRCTRELETTLEAITALRRLGAEVASLEPSPSSWAHLRARLGPAPVAHRRPSWAWRWRLSLGSMVASALLVAVVVGPLRSERLVGPTAESERQPTAELSRDLHAEAAFIAQVGVGNRTQSARAVIASNDDSGPVNYPDGLRPVVKEVTRSDRWPLTAT